MRVQNQSLSKLTPEQQEKVINNFVEAVQLMYQSMKQRKIKEFIEKIDEEMKNGGKKNGKYKRI